MTSSQTTTSATSEVEQSGEGPSSSGRIAGSATSVADWVEKSSEGPGSTGGIAGSAAAVRGTKRKLTARTFTEKYEAICEVEKGLKTKKQVALQFGIPHNTLSTWLKKKDVIKAKVHAGEMTPERKKARTAKFPEVEKKCQVTQCLIRRRRATIKSTDIRRAARRVRLGV